MKVPGLTSLGAIGVVALLWVSGLMAFGQRVANSTPAPDPPEADAVVALTGASSMRITTAMQLLENGVGRRLLISGVNRAATRADVREAAKAAGVAWDCCVDLGFQAATTQGNGAETAAWARRNRFRSLIVVTSDYHMPRSMLELQAAMPEVKLAPYPVATNTVDAKRWWRRGGDARRFTVEYSKYMAVLGRDLLLGAGSRAGKPREGR